ncbi:MAG: helix-turn-helix domain-containing protein, partial [bacterium]
MTMLEDIVRFPYLIRIYEPLSFLLLPSLFVYFSRLLDGREQMRPLDWLHFLPSIISFIVLLPFLFKSNGEKLQWLEASIRDYQYYKIWNFIYLGQLVIYIYLFGRKIRCFYKNFDKRNHKARQIKKQVVHFIFLVLIIFTVGLFMMIVFMSKIFYLAIPMQIFVFYVVYQLIKSSKIIELVYSKSESKEVKPRNLAKLVDYLNSTEDYYTPILTLEHVSKMTGVGIHEVSRYVNVNMGINFNDFVNQRRVEEAKKRFNNPEYQHHSLEGVGQSVGFKSKTTFYRAFKKFTGKTPGEYCDLEIQNPETIT